MTISSQTRKVGPFAGNDTSTVFPFDFKIFKAEDLHIVRSNDATGVETLLVLDTDYTAALNSDQNANPGGNVTLPAALVTGFSLTITSQLPYLQQTDLTNTGGFYPAVVTNALDRLTIFVQQLAERVGRSLSFPISDSGDASGVLPGERQRAGSVLAFDANGAPIVGPSIGDIDTVLSDIENVNTVAENITNVNTVSNSIASVNTVASNIDDVVAVADSITNVNAVAGSLTDVHTVADNIVDVTNFAGVYYGPAAADPTTRRDGTPLQAGDLYFNTTTNSLRTFSGTAWIEGATGAVTTYRFSGDGVAVAFTLAETPRSVNNTQVYISGVYQQKNTYSVAGTTLTFTEAPPTGTGNIEVVVLSVLPIGGTDPIDAADVSFSGGGTVESALFARPTAAALSTAAGSSTIGFQQSGTSAVGRSVQDKLRDIVSVQDFGVTGNGATNDGPAIVNAVNSGHTRLFFPTGTYRISTNTDIMQPVMLDRNAKFLVDAGVTLRFAHKPEADPYEYIFTGDGAVERAAGAPEWPDVSADWFGAKAIEVGRALNRAVKVGSTMLLSQREYYWATSFVVPQSRFLTLRGSGFRSTSALLASGSTIAINYLRQASTTGSSLLLEHFEFQEIGFAKTSVAIKWFGYSAGAAGSETVKNDDNWLRVNGCVFAGLLHGVWTRLAGQCHFNGNMSFGSSNMYNKERGSSFHWHTNEMCLGNIALTGAYIYGNDTVDDAYTNGLFISNCHSVTCAGLDIRLRAWQAVWIDGCGIDLGSAGVAAVWLQLCQDVHISNSWIAATSAAGTAGRLGVYADACRNSSFHNNTFTNNYSGIHGISSKAIGISDNAFDSNKNADIVDAGAGVGYTVTGNRHTTAVSSGTPIFLNSSGSGSHAIVGNVMAQASHSIPAGINSQVANNVFGAGF